MAMTVAERLKKHREKLGWRGLRNRHLLYEHGITLEQYESIVEKQGGKCPVCKKLLSETTKTKSPHVDHNHITGNIRGVLCGKCNRGIGFIEDNVEIAKNIIEYLKSTDT